MAMLTMRTIVVDIVDIEVKNVRRRRVLEWSGDTKMGKNPTSAYAFECQSRQGSCGSAHEKHVPLRIELVKPPLSLLPGKANEF